MSCRNRALADLIEDVAEYSRIDCGCRIVFLNGICCLMVWMVMAMLNGNQLAVCFLQELLPINPV